MTYEEQIKQMPKDDLAKLLIKTKDEDEWDYDYDDEPFICNTCEVYITSDDNKFYDYNDALTHQCWWLSQEVV